MASHEFFFALELSSQGAPTSLVDDLAAQVVRYVGCSLGAAPAVTAAVEKAIGQASLDQRRCDVQFRAHAGSLEILVSSGDGSLWQTSVLIP